MDKKLIASFIDTAASRADMIGANPATKKQCWFLACLIAKHNDQATYDEFVLNTSYVLTKSRASNLINDYMKRD